MIFLPGLIVVVVVGLCSCSEKEPASGLDESALECPGTCTDRNACITSISETQCAKGLTCCLDSLEKSSTTEFADADFTTESALDSTTVQEVENLGEQEEAEVEHAVGVDGTKSDSDEQFVQVSEEPEDGEDSDYAEITTEAEMYAAMSEDGNSFVEQEEEISEDEMDVEGNIVMVNNDPFRIVYSEETGETMMVPVTPEELQEQVVEESRCAGTCVTPELEENCPYVMRDSTACSSGTVCCLSEEDFQREQYVVDAEEVIDVSEDEQGGMSKRSTDHLMAQYNCPGTCVHPIHAVQCQTVLQQFQCPLNTKCCLLSSSQRAFAPKPTRCTGMCIPSRMAGHCLPPNELVMGPTSCAPNQACCTRNPSNIKPPHFVGMSYPHRPQPSNVEQFSNVLGHLAVDETGNIFKVSNRGDVSPLYRLPPGANLKDFVKVATYPRQDGELVVFSDKMGTLYQEFYSKYPAGSAKPTLQAPLHRQPVKQFVSQASEQSVKFEPADEKDRNKIEADLSSNSDIVIPDEDDEAPVTTNTPVIHTDKSSRPQCPGSCMSNFLRFTCFRGYAIYDGFTCPGRSMCCAKLTDIEEHEEYLKSLSPYFNVPPASKDPAIPRCGIKGRRDTPRIMGGKESLPGDWCWQVAVINLENQYMCGGALIDNSWVLTAAHCVSGPIEEGQAIFVRAGVTDLKSSEENSKGQTTRVLSTFIHHNYNSVNLDNNIALLRLQTPIELDSNACVVCLPTNRKMPEDNTKCTVTGYGFVSPDGDMSLRVREATVPIIDDMECMTNVTEALDNPFILPSSSFCAGGEGQTDACQGDAGGALVCKVGGFYELVGLVSWGLGCGRGDVPSIYVKVPAFMGWINQIISSNSFVTP